MPKASAFTCTSRSGVGTNVPPANGKLSCAEPITNSAPASGLVSPPARVGAAIAIAVAKHQLKARVLAIDVSPQALEVAAKNVEQYQLSERVKLIEGDLFASVDGKISFDLIASNPPYISESEYSQLSKEVRGHEPRAALLAGPTGTEVIARLVKQSESRLVAGGRLVIELSPMIAASVRELFAGSDAWYDLQVIKDIAGHARILSAARR